MNKIVHTPRRHLVGISKRTAPSMAQKDIMETVAYYQSLIRGHPPKDTYCVYTEYESDYRAPYTFFIGCEAPEDNAPLAPFSSLILPEQMCAHIPTKQGAMPHIIIDAWQNIWKQEDQGQLPGTRLYAADFEIYKSNQTDPTSMQVDIYIGLQKGH